MALLIAWGTVSRLATKGSAFLRWGSLLSTSLSEPLPLPPPQNVYVNINRIMSVANRLVESGHYASQQIKQIANQLEQEWKAFAAALDERSTLLDMSSIFHQKAEKVSAQNPQPTRLEPAPVPLPSCVSDSLRLRVGLICRPSASQKYLPLSLVTLQA